MKKIILPILVICFAWLTTQAQNQPVNPFEKYGYTPKIATLSKGKYVEFYDQDTIVQIGGAVFNTVTMKVMGFVEYDTIRNEYNVSPEVISRWLSPDPLSDEFPSWSPYNYVENNPIRMVDPTGMAPNDYTVDDKGNVELTKTTSDNFDVLSSKSDPSKSIRVNDQTILPQLAKDRSEYSGNYATSSNKSEVFNVFNFTANNTNVEWGIDGYRTKSGNEYLIRTSHKEDGVTQSTMMDKYSAFNQIFEMHSHPASDGTKGASGDWGNRYAGDMANIVNKYHAFKEVGMNNTKTWFKVDNKNTVFPKHYIYHKQSKSLYHFTPYKSSIPIRKINNSGDLHKNLGF